MGFGKSETPQDKEYTLKTHVENLARVINFLDLKNITYVGKDRGGLITGETSIRSIERIHGYVVLTI